MIPYQELGRSTSREVAASSGAPVKDPAMIDAEDSIGLLQLLNRLVVALGPATIADPSPGGRRDARIERWQDKEHVYLEANLLGAAESEIDISIHMGRVFIRIAR
jgi:HSP20 family molecular chaperone IbpA